MDREQIQRDGEKAVLTAWDRALTRPSETAVDTVQARLAVVAAQAPLLAAIDKLTARNAKLEAVAESGKAEHLAATAFLYAYEITIDKLVATDAGDHLNACRVHFARDSAALDALDG
jgi:hypothetical protein